MVTLELVGRVTHLLQAGHTPTEISAALGCSRKTVRTIRDGQHPLQQQPRRIRCPDCRSFHAPGVKRCLVAETLQILAFKKQHGNQPWNPYDERRAA